MEIGKWQVLFSQSTLMFIYLTGFWPPETQIKATTIKRYVSLIACVKTFGKANKVRHSNNFSAKPSLTY